MHRPSLHFTQNLGSFQRIKLSPNYLWYTCAASSTMINPVGNLGDSRLTLGEFTFRGNKMGTCEIII